MPPDEAFDIPSARCYLVPLVQNQAMTVNSPRVGCLALGLALLMLGLYLGCPTKQYYWDGVAFAIDIEKTETVWSWPLAHPNHLLFTLASNALHKALLALGLHTRALFTMQAISSFFGAATVGLMFLVLWRHTSHLFLSVTLALGLGFSATWWRFATDANAYVVSVFLLVACYAYLSRVRPPHPVMVASIHAAAMLLHQLSVFFYPVAAYCLIKRSGGVSRAGMLTVATYTSLAAALVLPVYALTHAHAAPNVPFWSWMTYHSPDAMFSFRPLLNAWLTLQGSVRLFVGGRLKALVPDLLGVLGLLAFAASVACLVLVLSSRRRALKEDVRRLAGGNPGQSSPALIWVISYVAFLFFWLPQNTFYRLYYLPPLVLLAASSIMRSGSWLLVRRVLPCLIAAIAAWNWTFSVYPQSRSEANRPLSFAMRQRQRWPSGTAVAFTAFHPDLWTISYFTPQVSWIGIDGPNLTRFKRQYHDVSASGMTLWIEGSMYDALKRTDEGQRFLDVSVDHGGSVVAVEPKHTFRFYRLKPAK